MSLKSSCSSLSKSRTPHLPMPDKDALYRSFNQLLGSLDLPDDKIEEMNSYDDQKKWEILCSRSLMKAHQSPSFYLCRLRSHVGLKTVQLKTDVTEILRGLEVSLRTYSIEWFRNFLSEKHALETFVGLLNVDLSSEHFQILANCLKAIMSDPVGFDMAINHRKLSDAMVSCLPKVSMKNRCNLLQLMSMACRKSSMGHERILKSLKSSDGGFGQLMDFLAINSKSCQMVIASTLHLIDAVVNSPLDMNYRVFLHYEFCQIGLDNRIERLRLNESFLTTEVIEEIKNFESMIINVNQLVKDRDESMAAARQKEAQKQSINCERHSEVEKKDGPAEVSENSKVDKVPDVDHKPEILQKSTVKIAPLMKADVVLQGLSPPPPPPPPVLMKIKKPTQLNCNLPSLYWMPLRPNQVRGTIFNGLNDEQLRSIINFAHFEDKFRIDMSQQSPRSSPLANRMRMPTFTTLLEPTRLRNVSIVLRKLNFDADVAIEAINDYDFNQLNLDSIDLLTNLAPKDSETEAYRNYKSDVAVLSEEDKFLMKLSRVERLTTKLAVMEFMGNFDDRADAMGTQISAITAASLSLKSSKKFKSILEIILSFGNRMNGNKSSGWAYGFRLKGTLARLNDARSNDKKLTLLEYIVTVTIAQQFPHLLALDTELHCIDSVARMSMRSISFEVENIKNGWHKLTEESKLSKSIALKTFQATSSEKFNKLINEHETARNNYAECARYFGEENAERMDSNEFFSAVHKFVSQFKELSDKVKP